MSLSDIVNISISVANANPTSPGFGIPLILSCLPPFSDMIRFYSSVAGMTADGFTTSSPEYLAASAIFAQNPMVKKIAIGRRTRPPTQRWAVTPTAVNNFTYKMSVNGNVLSYLSDGSATVTEIIAGLKTAIDALGLALTTSDQTTFLRILANTPGAWFHVSVALADQANLALKQDHADGGCAADLAAIKAVDDTWYGLINCWNSAAEVTAIAAWAEADKSKFFVALLADSDILGSGTGDEASTLKTANYFRTAPVYDPDNGSFLDAAWMGAMFPATPGSEDWIYKTLAGQSAQAYTATQQTNLNNKRCSFYLSVAGLSLTMGAKVASGEWIDVMLGRDWIQANMQIDMLALLATVPKLPYDDGGIQAVDAVMKARLQAAVNAGILSSFTTSVPRAADVSASDKQNRILNNATFNGTLSGAIHVTNVTGQVHV